MLPLLTEALTAPESVIGMIDQQRQHQEGLLKALATGEYTKFPSIAVHRLKSSRTIGRHTRGAVAIRGSNERGNCHQRAK